MDFQSIVVKLKKINHLENEHVFYLYVILFILSQNTIFKFE